MTVAVDTNVLLDVQTADPQHFSRSAEALQRAAAEGALIVGEVVYAELATRMPSEALHSFWPISASCIKHQRSRPCAAPGQRIVVTSRPVGLRSNAPTAEPFSR